MTLPILILVNFAVVLAGLALGGIIPWSVFIAFLAMVLLVFLVGLLLRLRRSLEASRCPKCRRYLSATRTRSTVLGLFRKYHVSIGGRQADDVDWSEFTPNLTGSLHEKVKVRRRCNKCVFEWETFQVQKAA